MATFIYSHNMGSEGAGLLKDKLGIKKIKHENSRFRGARNKRVINWGATRLPDEVLQCEVINKPDRVAICSNKLKFFQKIADSTKEIIPDFTTEFEEAVKWVGEGHTVCARQVLNGHSAEGLVLMEKNNPNGFVQAPLYTKYIKKLEEYRVHIVNGNMIDIQRKTLKLEKAQSGEEINWKIRNLENGFIYQREGIAPPECVVAVAVEAMGIVGLDFGAVDVVYNAHHEKAYVLEINTAPGITGTTVDSYAEALGE